MDSGGSGHVNVLVADFDDESTENVSVNYGGDTEGCTLWCEASEGLLNRVEGLGVERLCGCDGATDFVSVGRHDFAEGTANLFVHGESVVLCHGAKKVDYGWGVLLLGEGGLNHSGLFATGHDRIMQELDEDGVSLCSFEESVDLLVDLGESIRLGGGREESMCVSALNAKLLDWCLQVASMAQPPKGCVMY